MLEKKDFQKIGEVVDQKVKQNNKKLKVELGKDMDEKIDSLAVAVKAGFDSVDKRFDSVDKRFDDVYKRFDGVDKRFDGVDKDITHIRANMVTKHYLDEKIADLRGDIVVLLRKEDRKLQALIEKLKQKRIITDDEVKELQEIQLFAQ